MTGYPNAIWVPAHPTNFYSRWNHGGVPNQPRVIVLHTPEEKADNVEVTPYYFQTPNRLASTHYYGDNDGDMYQMVDEQDAAIANGVLNKPYPPGTNPNTSLNWQSISIEIEGQAASIHETMPVGGVQYNALVRWIRHRAAHYGIPLTRERIIGHYQVASNRTDPGARFPWTELIRDLQPPPPAEEDEDMPYLAWCPDRGKVYLIGPKGATRIDDPAIAAQLEKDLGPHKAAYSGVTIDQMNITP